MAKILILGSHGQLAADLLDACGTAAVGLSRHDLDVTDEAQTFRVLQSLKPAWVLNTAAFHRVDECETHASEAFAVNALGTGNVARMAAAVGAGVVWFSTDYVFGGARSPGQPYTEADCPHPLNVYGASKCAGEHLVRLGNPRHLIIRTASLFGVTTSRKGSTFPELMLREARSNGEVRVVHDQIMSPTSTADLAMKVKELIHGEQVGVFHLTNAGECSWFEFAREVFALAGIDVRMTAIPSAESGRRAPRPSYSALASVRMQEAGIPPMRPWQEALADYMRKKVESKGR